MYNRKDRVIACVLSHYNFHVSHGIDFSDSMIERPHIFQCIDAETEPDILDK
jgi:hypothetical protein